MTIATWCVPMEGVCLRKASMSLMGMGRIAYPAVSAVRGACPNDAEVELADVAAEDPLADPDRGRAACMDCVLMNSRWYCSILLPFVLQPKR